MTPNLASAVHIMESLTVLVSSAMQSVLHSEHDPFFETDHRSLAQVYIAFYRFEFRLWLCIWVHSAMLPLLRLAGLQ